MGLRAPIPEAERIKCDFGVALREMAGASVLIEVPRVGDRTSRLVPQIELAEILQPRAQELVELIVDVLDKDGRFEVRSVNNGFDAGMMVKEYHPDLIVLDVMLPDINGKEVCQRVRTDKSMDDVRIICISGMVEEDKIEDLKASGANDFLHKPFEVETLIERMCGLLDIEAVTSR